MVAMTLLDYITQLKEAVNKEDGPMLEACLSKDPQAIPMGESLMDCSFSYADIDTVCPAEEQRRSSTPTAVRSIAKEMLLYLHALKEEDGTKASQHYRGAYRVFVWSNAFFGGRGQSAWLLRSLASMSRGVMTLAHEAEIDDKKAQADVTGLFHTAVSACLRDRTQNPEDSKKKMAMYMIVVLFKHCFKINSLGPCKDLMGVLRSGHGDVEALACRADIVAFLFFDGLLIMRSAINDVMQRSEAEKKLTRSLKECHRGAWGNRRRILANLIPLRMQMGCLPERTLLEKYDLLIFDDFCTAIRNGNLGLFSLLMKRHEHALDMVDLHAHLENCRLLVYRRVLMKISKVIALNQIPLEDIKVGFVLSGHEFDGDAQERRRGQSMSRKAAEEQETYRYDQINGTLGRLIRQGLINGIIRPDRETLQLSQKNPFPSPPETSFSRVTRGSLNLGKQTRRPAAFGLD